MQLFPHPPSTHRSRGRLSALSLAPVSSIVTAYLLALACAPDSDGGDGVTVEQGSAQVDGNGGSGSMLPPLGLTPEEQMLYELPPPPGCGDFELNDDEVCDDGNLDNLDGCAGNCLLIETGYQCDEPGTPCTRAELCGDGTLVGAEGCDDGNADAEDGCASNCQIEAGYACPEPGELCVSTLVCGDGFVVLGETCDDGNAAAGDGCSDSCQLEQGWECLIANAKCRTICGDGLLIANERCDDGDTDPGDGCDALCRLEPNSVCRVPGEPCDDTVCADGTREGSEQCDDDNVLPYDGCTEDCINEPLCSDATGTYLCAAKCGDGMKFPEEACDDGNTDADDGCSPTCEDEDGYTCTDAAAELGDTLSLPVIIRDFSAGHPHFEIDPLTSPRLPGIVENQLTGSPGKPVYDEDFEFTFQGQTRPWTMDGPNEAGGQVANELPATLNAAGITDAFAQWYTDVEGTNVTFVQDLDLVFDDATDAFQFTRTGANQFFPIDFVGTSGNDSAGVPHNFHFTSEVRQWFEFQGGELLQFTGDDDVWVFVNGVLTVDLGGIHGEIQGSVQLPPNRLSIGQPSTVCVQDVVGGAESCSQIPVPLSENVNEIVVFQAERHITQSNYTLSLEGFNAPVTTCVPQCGDGFVTPDETCDEGPANGDGYGLCRIGLCVPGPRCGDGNVDEGNEECDNGVNQDGYFESEGSCAPGCVLPSSCGDGVIDARFREQCDDGVNDNSYGGCNSQCQLGPRCGDDIVDEEEEQCDDGNRRNNDGCNVNCAVERDPK